MSAAGIDPAASSPFGEEKLRQLVAVVVAFSLWLAAWVMYNRVLTEAGVLPPYVLAPLQAAAFAALAPAALLLVFAAVQLALRIAGGRSYAAGIALALLPAAFVYLQYDGHVTSAGLHGLLAAMVLASLVGCRLDWRDRPRLAWITVDDPGD